MKRIKQKIVDIVIGNKENLKAGEKLQFYQTNWFFIIAVVVFAAFFRSFFFSPFHIPSGSMKSNLLVGDYIFVSKYSYGFSRYSLPFGVNLIDGRVMKKEPERGDIIVFKLPTKPDVDYIKRLIGLPGDRIQVRGGIVFLNGKEIKRDCSLPEFLDEDYSLPKQIKQCIETLPTGKKYIVLDETPSGDLDNTKEYIVPPGHYFFMGDNRDNSQDSRVLSMVGYVPEANLVGRARVIVTSFKKLSRFFITLDDK